MKLHKWVILMLGIFLTALACLPSAGAEEIKLGYISLSEVFDEYGKTKQFDSDLEKETDKNEKRRQEMVEEIRKLKDEMLLLSDKAKEEKQTVVDEKISDLQEFVKDARDDLRKERDEMVRDILREIDKVIQIYGKESGYTVILNDRMLVYGEETIDITQDIIDILNKKYNTKEEE